MKKHYKLIIVGGGASGLSAAVTLALNGLCFDVLVLERLSRVGKKLLSTGNGQGNVGNVNVCKDNYHSVVGDAREFVTPLLENFSVEDLTAYFSGLGVTLKEKQGGKLYPYSMQASTVLDALRNVLESKKVDVLTDAFVKDIKKEKAFVVCLENGETFTADNVLLAVGGSASKQFGTDGFSYCLAKTFGHKVTETFPSLVQLKTDTQKIKALKGLKADVIMTAYDGNSEIRKEQGELLFTEYGVSGPVTFYLSGYLSIAKKPNVKIEFLPDLSEREIEKIVKKNKALPFIKEDDILNGLMNKHIARAILKDVDKKDVTAVVKTVKNFRLTVLGTTGFNNAQVTKGGVKTSEVDALTFESKMQKGLYFSGEVLDIDGDCGGFNLHFAIGSGVTVAKNILAKYKG